MKIIAVDPGYGRLGIAVLQKNRSGEAVLFSECFETSAKEEHQRRLQSIQARLRELLVKFKPEALAIESLFFSKNQKTALAVAEARGVIIAEAGASGIPVFEYKPSQVKIAVTGYGASDKRQVQGMLKQLLHFDKKALDDEYDAIAIGLTHLAIYRNR